MYVISWLEEYQFLRPINFRVKYDFLISLKFILNIVIKIILPCIKAQSFALSTKSPKMFLSIGTGTHGVIFGISISSLGLKIQEIKEVNSTCDVLHEASTDKWELHSIRITKVNKMRNRTTSQFSP